MNKYEKNKNILQALLEIGCIKSVLLIMFFTIAPLLIGFLMQKIPYISNKIAPKNMLEYFVFVYLIGLIVIGVAYGIYLCIVIVARIVNSISVNLYAARIMQYLPLSTEDWKRLNAKTDEEAIHILRDLVKTIGYRNDLKKCEELRDEIAESYRAFLIFKYGKDYTVTFNNASALVLCPDEEFDELLKNEYDNYNNEKRPFPDWIF
ncbi:MAG: hypothetical protein K6B67_05645 [Lachnospiraceae bacterium]|nr:hypothetical protein [Lachnospiraceae bacterium]